VGSNERSGLPLKGRDPVQAVWVNLPALFPEPSTSSVASGLVIDEVAPGGLHRWERTADGQWIGVVTIVMRRADGSTFKAADQLVPALALRPRNEQRA
jgi:hypothetical protein